MTEQERADAILAALPWRCFHCDFVTADRDEALAHFGERDDAEEFKPICKWWDGMSEAERKETLQDTLKQLNERGDEVMRLQTRVEGLEYQVGSTESCIKSYKPFRNCRSIYDVFCEFDSMEGRAIAASAALVAERERCAKLEDALRNLMAEFPKPLRDIVTLHAAERALAPPVAEQEQP